LDIYLPNEHLAFEYQGKQHHTEIHCFNSSSHQRERDEEKRHLCFGNNITLIEIPYWWTKDLESLKATISQYRPDLF
jgi:hypothetical protein